MRCLSVLPLALLALPASADAQTATGTLTGTIRDTTSAVLPGVIVTIRNVATGATRSVTTDGEGRYRIVNVDPGGYELRAQLDGFRTVVRNPVVISVGGMAQSDIEMTVGAVAETVTVQVEAPLIEPGKTDLSRVVTTQEIESLPIAGRNFVDFVKLSSAVALGRENVGGGAFKEPDVGVGSAAAPRLSFGVGLAPRVLDGRLPGGALGPQSAGRRHPQAEPVRHGWRSPRTSSTCSTGRTSRT